MKMFKLSLLTLTLTMAFTGTANAARSRCQPGQKTSTTNANGIFCPDDGKCWYMKKGTHVTLTEVRFFGDTDLITHVSMIVEGAPSAKEVRNEAGQLVACSLVQRPLISGEFDMSGGGLYHIPFDCD